ncbi:hypothetical protein KAFR_0E01370 [Kazachstania africana CBS 2517]|uniref:HDA1 complex subunit 2 n=1 Tax=Kazachstania africana (strain ATCC 22294 / BCRC 22015 / CBS 2517 / CECT 1963 / NBRC 1671 / NRRL Y-8276) TaxID=1071382 RepID=H2AV91_KAZAF|nr:hypothetical protein KAFR_0E01370 [Kazachstania africana CBS 2517]CCF58291.1 hypothetical protein KAFR_0E01370 [Kazachstania africana CBS 2517]
MNSTAHSTKQFYLPIGLTAFQKDLVEILLNLHKHSFESELQNTDIVKNEQTYPQLSTKQLNYMFDSHIRSIANHPFLLVDHYMPGQFLKLESTENLVNASLKLQILQKLLLCLVDKSHKDNSKFLKLVIIAHSVKELDLIEGLLLGSKFKIKRLSGTSLHDEKHKFPKILPTPSNNSPTSSSPSLSSSNSYTGYPKDDYDYSIRRQLKRQRTQALKSENWIFLTTTTHLTNDNTLLSNYTPLDLVISFDPFNLPVFQQGIVPTIKLLVKDSPDHYILNHGLGDVVDHDLKYKNMVKSISHFLQNRNIDNNTNNIDYNAFIDAILNEDTTFQLPDIKLSRENKDVSIYMTPKFEEKVLLELDWKSYQTELMKLTMNRLNTLTSISNENESAILNERSIETERQNNIDRLKGETGAMFKQFQDNEKVSNEAEKKLERITTEQTKLEEKLTKLREKKANLEELLSSPEDKSTAFELLQKELQGQLSRLHEINEQRSKECEGLRNLYQMKSTSAATKSAELDATKKLLEESQKSKAKPSLTLESTLLTEAQLSRELESIRSQNRFLNNYISKMTSDYDLTNTSSTASVERSRIRSTRSSTPSYTG